MTNGLLFELSQQWIALKNERKDLDFRRAQWARKAIAACGSSEKFTFWFVNECKEKPEAAKAILAEASAAAVVADAKQWKDLGGKTQIMKLANLPKPEQIAVIQSAKATGSSIQTELNRRARAKNPKQPFVSKPAVPSAYRDAVDLSRYLKTLDSVPPQIMRIVDRYV